MTHTSKAFTLIELLVVMTIMFILSMLIYAPYQNYQLKQKIRNSAKIITQTLYEARNYSINGKSTASGNLSIGVYFGSGAESITLYHYPYSLFGTIVDFKDPKYIFEIIPLDSKVQIKQIGAQNNGLFIYESISGSGSYYYFDSSNNKQAFLSTGFLNLTVGMGNSISKNSTKDINYYMQTYVSDVQ